MPSSTCKDSLRRGDQCGSMGEVRPSFMELLNGHQGVIHRICRVYATDHADRQDLFQDIVYQLWRSYPEYRGDSSPITWLYRVALNTALTTVRRRSRRPRLVPLDAAPEPSAPLARADNDALHRVIGRLGRIDRAIVPGTLAALWARRSGRAYVNRMFGSYRAELSDYLRELEQI